jgi:hypothetical protein
MTSHARDRRRGDSGEAARRPEPLPPGLINQSVSNAALARRILARTPPDTSKKVGHKTGKEIDAALDASAYFKPLIADAVKAGKKADGHVHIHGPADFIKACVAYLAGKENPETSKTFTDDEAKEFAKSVNAFQDGLEIHVNEERGEPATTVHESMHLFTHADFDSHTSWNFSEGTTEYFTKKLCAEMKLTRGNFYPDQYGAVKKLADHVTESVLAEAYFHGKWADLEAAFDKKGKKGDFQKWLDFIAASKYTEAKALTP